METKKQFLEQAEIKVKNLISYLYESESDSLDEISKLKKNLNQRVTELEEYIANVTKQREDLQSRFDDLKKAKDAQWDQAKEYFESQINYIESDRDTFIKKAELIISNIGSKIQELEEKAVNAASNTKTDLNEKIKDLKKSRGDLEEKMDRIKSDTSDHWKDLKGWFTDQYQSVKERFSSRGKS